MTIRTNHPDGVPCWVDLWTSDVEGSRRFYGGLFGWEAAEPDPTYGGYFVFTRNGDPIAGGMGDVGEPGGDFHLPADDTWKPILATADIRATVTAAESAGAQITVDCMQVGPMGWQAEINDPTGARLGLWQPGDLAGFTVIDEPGAPTWFELHTRDHAGAVAFYRDVFGLETEVVADSDEFRYTTLCGPSDCGQVAGIMDASGWLADDAPAHWSVYWYTDDVDTSVATVVELGGAVVAAPEHTPYGRIATVTDPAGAQFKLRTVTEG